MTNPSSPARGKNYHINCWFTNQTLTIHTDGFPIIIIWLIQFVLYSLSVLWTSYQWHDIQSETSRIAKVICHNQDSCEMQHLSMVFSDGKSPIHPNQCFQLCILCTLKYKIIESHQYAPIPVAPMSVRKNWQYTICCSNAFDLNNGWWAWL